MNSGLSSNKKGLLMISVKGLEVPTAVNAPRHENKCQQLRDPAAARSKRFISNNERKQRRSPVRIREHRYKRCIN